MELTATDFWRLEPLYPQKQFKRKGEALYIACQRQKDAMRLHVAKEKGYGEIKPLSHAILQCHRDGFSLQEMAKILEYDLDTIGNEWDRLRQNAR